LLGLVLAGVAVLLACRNFTLSTTVKILSTEVEFTRVDAQSLKQQLEAERILSARQLADLKNAPALDSLWFVRLTPPAEAVLPMARAIIAWQPAAAAGILLAEQLPSPAPDEEYRLWLENASGQRSDLGVIAVSPTDTAPVKFFAAASIDKSARFILTNERKTSATASISSVILSGSF